MLKKITVLFLSLITFFSCYVDEYEYIHEAENRENEIPGYKDVYNIKKTWISGDTVITFTDSIVTINDSLNYVYWLDWREIYRYNGYKSMYFMEYINITVINDTSEMNIIGKSIDTHHYDLSQDTILYIDKKKYIPF